MSCASAAVNATVRRGHTLVEMVVAMTSASVLMVGLASAVMVTSRAFRPETTTQHVRTDVAFAEHGLLADLQLATGFTERTDKAATFTVPDRDGDGRPETLRYAWSGASGDPLTFHYNGAAAIPLVKDVRDFKLSYVTNTVAGINLPAEQTGSQILLLVNDSDNPTADELSRKSLIESWNFVVVMRGLNDGGDAVMNAADAAKAVYVSGTVDATKFDLAAKFAEISVGIVNEHPDLVEAWGLAASVSTSVASQVNVVNNTHYITSGLATGIANVMNFPVGMSLLKDTPAPNLNGLATVGSIPALATIDPGKTLHDGRTAAGRRVMLPWGGAKFDPTYLNSNGQLLTCRAIEWATGLGDVSPELRNFGYETVFSSTNSATNNQMAVKATLSEKGTVRSISAYVGGADAQLRFAIYSDKNGQPDRLLVQSNIGNSTTSMAWVTLPVPPTQLTSGSYWLSFSFVNSSQKYRYISSHANAGERNKAYAAVPNGFLASWGASNNSYNGARSIYATYEVAK